MRKRGLILLVLTAVFLATILLINALPTDVGCCANPENLAVCSWITEMQCCTGAADYNGCVSDYFYDRASCGLVPNEICKADTPGTCKNTADPNFCTYVEYKAKCFYRADFAANTLPENVDECRQGCCICVDGTGSRYIWDTTYAYGGAVTTGTKCSQFCRSATYRIAVFNTSITDASICLAGFQVYAKANLSGYVRDMAGNAIANAVVKAGLNQTNTTASGFYRLTDLAPMPGRTITVSHALFATNTTLFNIKPGENQLDFRLASVELGTITGFVIDTNKMPLQNAAVSAGTVSDVTDINGSYTITGVQKFQAVEITAYFSTYRTEKKIVTITADIAYVNFSLEKTPIAEVHGTVLDESGGVEGALVILSNPNFPSKSANSLSNGNFHIPDVEVYEQGTLYTISATKDGYQPATRQQILKPGDNIVSVGLVQYAPSCGIDKAIPPNDFAVNDVRGEKALVISWSNPCKIVSGYYLFKGDKLIKYFDVIPPQKYFSYADRNVEWGSSYTYKIIAAYNIAGNSSVVTRTQNMGNALCEGRYGEFCSQKVYRKKCDDGNNVVDIEDCSASGTSYFCAGPDRYFKTYCKNAQACSPMAQNAAPFGLYYKIFGTPSCWGSMSEEQYDNYCYWDYSNTIVDKCSSCDNPELTSCFDYKSKLACELDNQTCIKGGGSACGWVYTLPELGKGLCYQLNYNGTDRCGLCSEGNLFFNLNCNQDVCSRLGSCYANAEKSSCMGCTNARCSDYTTAEQCGSAMFVNNCGEITAGSDACNLGVCRWDNSTGRCFKDGNADRTADCSSTDLSCLGDSKPAESDIVGGYVTINSVNAVVAFTTDEPIKGMYYCIDSKNKCCDFKAVSNNRVDLRSGSWYISGKDTYYIRFYSTDAHDNREAVRWRKVYADFKAPVITVSKRVIPNGGKGDLIIDITTDELVRCSDKLKSYGSTTYSESKLSDSKIEGYRAVSYSSLDYDTYSYEISCSDNAGNSVSRNMLVTVDNPFITVERPRIVTMDSTFKFIVTTQQPSSCELFYLGTSQGVMQTAGGISHSSAREYQFDANRQYAGYSVKCLYSGGLKEQDILFTVDKLSPATTAVLTVSGEQRKDTGSRWEESFNKVDEVSLSFECTDAPATGFGCSKTVYCFDENNTGFCEPDSEISVTDTVELTETATVCYYSTDGHNPAEQARCGTVAVNRVIGARITEPRYGVSDKPNFKVRIKTTKAADSCKYLAVPSPFDYNSVVSDANIFEPAGDQMSFEKENFPTVVWGHGFSATNAIGYTKGKPYTFDMYAKCEDLNGAVSEESAYFELRYDPSAPVIANNYVSQELYGTRLIGNDVITGHIAVLNAVTDDETLCKYSKTETRYDSMENGFEGFMAENFRTVHFAVIENPEDKKSYAYHVQCKNKAGLVSSLTDMSFSVDRTKTGVIKSAAADVKDNFAVEFTVVTDKSAVCRYSGKINGTFSSEHGFTHRTTSDAYKDDEGNHELNVGCLFAATGATAEAVIKFSIDKKAPVMKNISLGDYVCDITELHPAFGAEDDISGVKEYDYKLKEKGLTGDVIAEGTTSQSSPIIGNIEMDIGDKYELSARAIDNAGNIGNWLSADFAVEDSNSTRCREKSPPSVSIKEKLNADKTKSVEIICTDDVSCDGIYYGTAASIDECTPAKQYTAAIIVDHTLYLCYEAFDTADNNRSGVKKITVSATKDSDDDGIADSADICPNTPSSEIYEVVNDSSSADYGCSKSQVDSDKDGMPDYWEIRYNLDPHDSNDRELDLDKDGVSNYNEYLAHTDPTIADASDLDKDGVSDNADNCPYTPFNAVVDEKGCSAAQLDIDGDNILNKDDRCDNTPYDEINKIITDSSDEYYGCSPSERPGRRTIPLMLLTLGLIFAAGGLSYIIYKKYIMAKGSPFRQLLKKQQPVRIVSAVRQMPKPAVIPPVLRMQPREEITGAEERRRRAIEAIKRQIEARKKRRELFKAFEAKGKK